MKRNLAVLLVAGIPALSGVPLKAWAQAAPPAGPSAADPHLVAEGRRLRVELDRANAEIDALKSGPRGVRTDYLLRQRMADAESLARRLTDVEASLRGASGSSQDARPLRVGPEPTVAPTDGPADIEAKADILADQARRLGAEADRLARRAGDIRGRYELRRRAGQLDRDPFAGMEGSKRRMLTVTPGLAGEPRGGAPESKGTYTNMGTPAPPPASPTLGPASAPRTPPASGGAAREGDLAPISSRLRDLLDPGTLADVRRLEGAGGPAADAQALERAAAALRQKAERLDAQSKALRKKAKP